MSEEIKETQKTQPAQSDSAAKTGSSPAESSQPGATRASSHNQSNRSDNNRGGSRNDSRQRQNDGGDKRQRFSRFKKKVCKFCHNKELPIDYKRPDILIRFLTDRGKILPRRITGACAKHQRRVASEVKRARMIALLPFVEK